MQFFFFQYVAQITNPQLSNVVSNYHPIQFFNSIIPTLINIALVLGVIAFIFILILGGIHWITSAGNKAKVEEARSKITQALTGLVILFSFFALVQLLNLSLGINIGSLGVPPEVGDPPPTPTPTSIPIPTPTPDPCNVCNPDLYSSAVNACWWGCWPRQTPIANGGNCRTAAASCGSLPPYSCRMILCCNEDYWTGDCLDSAPTPTSTPICPDADYNHCSCPGASLMCASGYSIKCSDETCDACFFGLGECCSCFSDTSTPTPVPGCPVDYPLCGCPSSARCPIGTHPEWSKDICICPPPDVPGTCRGCFPDAP